MNFMKLLIFPVIALGCALVAGVAAADPVSFTVSGGSANPFMGVTGTPNTDTHGQTCGGTVLCSPDTVTLYSNSGEYTADGTYDLDPFKFTVLNSHSVHGNHFFVIHETITLDGDASGDIYIPFYINVSTGADTLTLAAGGDGRCVANSTTLCKPFVRITLNDGVSRLFTITALNFGSVGYFGDDNHDPNNLLSGMLQASITDPVLGFDDEFPGADAPEPSSLAMFGVALLALTVAFRRKMAVAAV